MHSRRGSAVKGHYRNGSWVSPHYRNGTIVSEGPRASAGNPNSASRSYPYPLQFRTVVSFANPNASCPVCGCPVFFYQSPHGGRVYFDDLGPPWPKHPCTDNPTFPKDQPVATKHVYVGVKASTDQVSSKPQWLSAGWMPFICTKVDLKGPNGNYCQLDGLLDGKQTKLYLCTQKPPNDALMQVRQIHPNEYEVSMIWFEPGSMRAREKQFTAFLNQLQAIAWKPLKVGEKKLGNGLSRVIRPNKVSGKRRTPLSSNFGDQKKRAEVAKKNKLDKSGKAEARRSDHKQKLIPAASDTPSNREEPNKFGSTMWNAFHEARSPKKK